MANFCHQCQFLFATSGKLHQAFATSVSWWQIPTSGWCVFCHHATIGRPWSLSAFERGRVVLSESLIKCCIFKTTVHRAWGQTQNIISLSKNVWPPALVVDLGYSLAGVPCQLRYTVHNKMLGKPGSQIPSGIVTISWIQVLGDNTQAQGVVLGLHYDVIP